MILLIYFESNLKYDSHRNRSRKIGNSNMLNSSLILLFQKQFFFVEYFISFFFVFLLVEYYQQQRKQTVIGMDNVRISFVSPHVSIYPSFIIFITEKKNSGFFRFFSLGCVFHKSHSVLFCFVSRLIVWIFFWFLGKKNSSCFLFPPSIHPDFIFVFFAVFWFPL